MIGADSALEARIGAFYLSCATGFCPEPPEFRNIDTVALLPFPDDRGHAEKIPRTVPFIGCGASEHIDAAFAHGAADYLCAPWTEGELDARLRRLLIKAAVPLPEAEAVLQGAILSGPAGISRLSFEEAYLLRLLKRQESEGASRAALRRILWPRLPEGSRIVDETVSRLRRRLLEAGISRSCLHIRSIRGFGYRIEHLR